MKKLNGKFSFKKFNPSNGFIAIICVLLGIGGTLLVQSVSQHHQRNLYHKNFLAWHHQFLDDDFFDQHMASIEESFAKNRQAMQQAFERAEKSSDLANKSSVSTKEDDKFFYYELSFAGFKPEEVKTEAKDGELKFLGEKKVDEKGNKSQQRFSYFFSTPQTKNKKEPEIIKQDNKIIVKFAK